MTAAPGLRHVLAHVSDSPASRAVLAAAVALAAAHDAALEAVYAVDAPPVGAFLSPETAAVAMAAAAQDRQARAERAVALLDRVAPHTTLDGEARDPLAALVRRSFTTDVIVCAPVGAEEPTGHAADLVEKLLLAAGCPLLFAPARAGRREPRSRDFGRRVLVAWSASRECARAVRDALPILRRAESVELMHRGEDEDALRSLRAVQAHLRRHGVAEPQVAVEADAAGTAARPALGPSADSAIAQALLRRAADTQADLIVMGGYGRLRALEWMFGGVTRSMLRTMTVPVLMSH